MALRFSPSRGAAALVLNAMVRGPQGAAATLAVGTVVSIPTGSTPVVTNVGTSSAAIFNFQLPQGPTGPISSAFFRVRTVATSNVTIASGLENGDTLGGVTLAAGEAVLLTAQSTASQNGVYVVASLGAASRHSTFAAYNDLAGAIFEVMEGTDALTFWRCTSLAGGTIGSTSVAIYRMSKKKFVFATGQSNIKNNVAYSWAPPPNLLVWNWDLVDGHVGTAFAAASTSTINPVNKFSADIAADDPLCMVFVCSIAISSMDISHWMVGASSPDMYTNITANMTPALAAAGVSTVDVEFWWQGESQTTNPYNYANDFNTVHTRFQTNSWYPRNTPVIIMGNITTALSGSRVSDETNERLMACALAENETRRFVNTSIFGASYWADTAHPTAAGYFAIGAKAADAYLHGISHNPSIEPTTNRLRNGALGPASRSKIRGSDFTANPWRYGTSFTSAADGTQVADGWYYLQPAGAGAVSVLKTADAPTSVQSGVYTSHCLHVDVTTAEATLGAGSGKFYGIEYRIDGSDVARLGFGQTQSKFVTISFWKKETQTGLYSVYLSNSARDRTYNVMYNILVADTWEYKSITIPVDTSGTWLTTAGTVGLIVGWPVASSNTFLFGADAWQSGDVRYGDPAMVNGLSSTNNNSKIALAQIEEGKDASIFDPVSLPIFPQVIPMAGSTTGGATSYLGAVVAATESHAQITMPFAGRCIAFYASLDAVPGVSNQVAFTVRKNGSDQTLTATVGAAATTANDTAANHGFDFVAGDKIAVKQVVSAATSSTRSVANLGFIFNQRGI